MTTQATDVERIVDRALDIVYRYRLRPAPGFEYVSAAATRVTGYTPEEHYADPELGFKLVEPEDRPMLAELRNVGPSDDPVLLRWRRKDGVVIWTEQRNVPVFDERGELVAIEGIAREIPDPTRTPGETMRLVGGLRINLLAQRVFVDGKLVHLTPSEFKLLAYLTAHVGEVVSRDLLMRQLWGSDFTGGGHACENYVSGLRRKIEPDPRFPERIVTVRGRGYRYTGR